MTVTTTYQFLKKLCVLGVLCGELTHFRTIMNEIQLTRGEGLRYISDFSSADDADYAVLKAALYEWFLTAHEIDFQLLCMSAAVKTA